MCGKALLRNFKVIIVALETGPLTGSNVKLTNLNICGIVVEIHVATDFKGLSGFEGYGT